MPQINGMYAIIMTVRINELLYHKILAFDFLLVKMTVLFVSWIWGWFSWSSSSSTMLRAAEKKILSCK